MGALVIPRLAEHRPSLGLLFPASACAVSAVVGALIAHDPPRKPRTAAAETELVHPYRGSAVLWRIHAISALMVMPLSMTVTFMLVWLTGNHGWSVRAAGALVTITQLLAALTRIAAGRWSDYVVPPKSWRFPLCGFPVGGRSVLLVDGADHPDRAVPPDVVVEAVAPVKHASTCLHNSVEHIAGQHFPLQRGEERLSGSVVET